MSESSLKHFLYTRQGSGIPAEYKSWTDVCTTTCFTSETACGRFLNSIQQIVFFTRRLVTLSSTCQHQSQSPLCNTIRIDYFHRFSSFMKLMWSCYEDFMAWTLTKVGNKVLWEKRGVWCPLTLYRLDVCLRWLFRNDYTNVFIPL